MAVSYIARLRKCRAELIVRRKTLKRQHRSAEIVTWHLIQTTAKILKWELRHSS